MTCLIFKKIKVLKLKYALLTTLTTNSRYIYIYIYLSETVWAFSIHAVKNSVAVRGIFAVKAVPFACCPPTTVFPPVCVF